MELLGKTALVTGASRGLGLALARSLGERGVNLIIVARGGEALDAARESLVGATGRAPACVVADVGDDAETVVAAGMKRFGAIDILINNASELGPSPMPALADLAWRAMERILRINVAAPLHLIQLTLPQMLARAGGTIVNISSDAGVNAYPHWGGYGASKAALEHLSRVLATELAGTPIRVLVVDPGDMDTQMHRDAEPGVDMSHLARPEQVAPAIVKLIEDDAIVGGRHEAQALLAEARS